MLSHILKDIMHNYFDKRGDLNFAIYKIIESNKIIISSFYIKYFCIKKMIHIKIVSYIYKSLTYL